MSPLNQFLLNFNMMLFIISECNLLYVKCNTLIAFQFVTAEEENKIFYGKKRNKMFNSLLSIERKYGNTIN